MKRLDAPTTFQPVTLVLETEAELRMLRVIAQNVQPGMLAGWSELIQQSEASSFLTSLWNAVQP